jgi:hypothetical protein
MTSGGKIIMDNYAAPLPGTLVSFLIVLCKGAMCMKAFKISILLAITVALCLGVAASSMAKDEPKAPPGPLQAYLLCLESTTDKPGAPKARWNLMVAFPKPGVPMANISGQLILAQVSTKPPLYITFMVKGTYNTKNGEIKWQGKGGGTDNAAYLTQGIVTLEMKSEKGPYVIEYKRVGAKKWMKTTGQAMTAPCVQSGALR